MFQIVEQFLLRKQTILEASVNCQQTIQHQWFHWFADGNCSRRKEIFLFIFLNRHHNWCQSIFIFTACISEYGKHHYNFGCVLYGNCLPYFIHIRNHTCRTTAVQKSLSAFFHDSFHKLNRKLNLISCHINVFIACQNKRTPFNVTMSLFHFFLHINSCLCKMLCIFFLFKTAFKKDRADNKMIHIYPKIICWCTFYSFIDFVINIFICYIGWITVYDPDGASVFNNALNFWF